MYYPFYSTPQDTGRTPICSELQQDETGRYYIDFDDVEAKIKEHNIKVFILCNPHNPVSRIWSEEEMVKLFTLCEENNILIVSDEIHEDFIFGTGSVYSGLSRTRRPLQRFHYHHYQCVQKAFNLASLPVAHTIIPNEAHRKQFDAYVATIDHTQLPVLDLLATETAYQTGDAWLNRTVGCN